MTLPPVANVPGLIYRIIKLDGTANTVTIDPNGSETINGALTEVISSQYVARSIISTGNVWIII